MSKTTFVVNYPVLNMGGIESGVHLYIKNAISHGMRVVWLCYKEKTIAESFRDILDKVECVIVNGMSAKSILAEPLVLNGKVIILSYTPLFLSRALLLSHDYRHCDITNIYLVANTRGRFYYPEESFPGLIKKWVAKKSGRIIESWAKLNYVRFYTPLQAQSFEKHCNYKFTNIDDVIVPPAGVIKKYDVDLLEKRIDRKEFNLISVTRFQFPHKQYVIGLIKDYGQLKKKYKKIKLHIVGYGPGLPLVKRTINELDEEAKKDVVLYGELGMDQIEKLMESMHLNISVAGSVNIGVRCGVLSIPARNFCENDCEVYGFLPDNFDKTTSTEPGQRAIDYIEKVINMSDDEYRQNCEAAFEKYYCMKRDPNYLFNQKNELQELSEVKKAFDFYRKINGLGDLFFKLKKMFGVE